MELKLRAITLRAVNYKDNDRILTLITPEKGKISVSAKGVRKANAKMKAVSEPFCLSDCVFYERLGRITLTEAEITDTFFPLREKILLKFDKEIPHGVAVTVNDFHQREDGVYVVDIDVVCEKPGKEPLVPEAVRRANPSSARKHVEVDDQVDHHRQKGNC